jgi:vacuolar-type H+-ATPase catalytic subunit A/Vma1
MINGLLCILLTNKTGESIIRWTFTPGSFHEGHPVSGGDMIGVVYENEIIDSHKIICPPMCTVQ